MRGSSRAAAAAGKDALTGVLSDGAENAALADDLFAAAKVVGRDATLRRALTDPSRDGEAKRGLVTDLFGGKVGEGAVTVLGQLAAGRWSDEGDLVDTIEALGVEAVLARAESAGEIERVENELFRFERLVAGTPDLRDAVTNRYAEAAAKDQLVVDLLEGKAAPATVRLARQAVTSTAGRRFARTIEEYLDVAAERRQQFTAVVTSAIEMDAAQRDRLTSTLSTLYGRTIQLQTVVDPTVMAGVKIEVADEVIDGTILTRLDDVRRDFGN